MKITVGLQSEGEKMAQFFFFFFFLQTIHMKCQALFSLKNKIKIEFCMLYFWSVLQMLSIADVCFKVHEQSTLVIPTLDTMTKFVIKTI